MPQGPDGEDLRRRRREWIAAHHPDRGGDPDEFAAGLARFGGSPPDGSRPEPAASHLRPTVYRSKNPVRRLRRLVRSLRRTSSRRLL